MLTLRFAVIPSRVLAGAVGMIILAGAPGAALADAPAKVQHQDIPITVVINQPTP